MNKETFFPYYEDKMRLVKQPKSSDSRYCVIRGYVMMGILRNKSIVIVLDWCIIIRRFFGVLFFNKNLQYFINLLIKIFFYF